MEQNRNKNQNYELLSKEIIECPYCKSIVSLYYIKSHMKTKKCLEMKKHYLICNNDNNKSESEIELYINDLKKEAKINNNNNL
jgi:uncharacterized protein YbaR (Trm112 family)